MLKVMFTIDCDICRGPFETAAVCSDPDSLIWQSFALDLTGYVEASGWDFDEVTQRFRCDGCLEAVEEELVPEETL
jgi:hypothetical protein